MKTAIQIAGAPAPIGPYSQAIKCDNFLYISGQIPLNPFTGELVTTCIEEATHQVLKNIRALIQEAGMSMDNIVKCSIFLTNLEDFSSVNAVYASYFGSVPPARETVQVVKLPLGVPIEISCIAVVNG
jgi:2-iminobutanoate/2-iminopropanoate deaminase